MIEIKGLGKSYGPKKVLEKVNLTVPDASVFGLVGINGAGKTTLLRMMADVLRPDEGTVEYDGENIAGNAKKRKELFFLPDDPYYAAGTTVEKLVELYKSFYSFDDELFSRYEKLFSLERRTPVRNFSKGMKRQAFAALALACRPKYLLLDEAFDGLDPLARLELKRGIISLEGTTAVISSHSLRELEDICSGFALLDGGAVADAGDLAETLERVHKFQAAFDEPGWCASSSAASAKRSSRRLRRFRPSLWKRSKSTLRSSSSAKSGAGGICHEKAAFARTQTRSSAPCRVHRHRRRHCRRRCHVVELYFRNRQAH